MIAVINSSFIAYGMRQMRMTIGLCASLLLLVACSPKTENISIQLMWNRQPLTCGAPLPGHEQWQLAQLQFYLSSLTNNDEPLAFTAGPAHQQPGVALLGSDCQAEGQWQLTLSRALQAGTVGFDLGVPFELNHQNPLRAGSPLDQSDMFWTWQQGHKFLRLDLTRSPPDVGTEADTITEAPQTGWQLHLGSSGCQSASVMRAPGEECAAPNRPRVTLEYLGQRTLVLDLAPLLSELLAAHSGSGREAHLESCMSDPHSRVCQALLPALGIGGESRVWRWL